MITMMSMKTNIKNKTNNYKVNINLLRINNKSVFK